MEPPLTTATNLAPSADEATAFQLAMGALLSVQVCAKTGLTTISRPPRTAATSSANLTFVTNLIEELKGSRSGSAQFLERFRLHIILMFSASPYSCAIQREKRSLEVNFFQEFVNNKGRRKGVKKIRLRWGHAVCERCDFGLRWWST